jgi:hypothetical protein
VSPKKIIVQRVNCVRNPENSGKNAGFQITGFKNSTKDLSTARVGFIVSGVRLVSFQQVMNMGIRTRMKWIPKGFEIREEIHPLNGVVVDLQRRNNVLFVSTEDNSMVVVQGEPTVRENGFIGQMVQIDWQPDEVQILPIQKQFSFHCTLSPKNHRIDCLVK